MKFGVALVVAISMLGAGASMAGAADSIYWTNYDSPATVSVSNLDGSGSGRDLFTAGAPRGGSVAAPAGLALDPASGWAYWANAVSVARGSLDGCDAAAICATNLYPLLAGGPPVASPSAPALDTAHGLMYWMNNTGVLVRASLDGSGAVNETVDVSGSSMLGGGGAGGLVIDPRTNRIYWTSDDFGDPGAISWANLDGSGGGDLNTSGANVSRPWGLAIDTASNRVYWAAFGGGDGGTGSISWASLDGTGGGNLYTAASPGCGMINGPNGIAIDRAANKIYWANYEGNTISSANLDGTGGCTDVGTAGASLNGPDEVAILKTPVAQTAPAISGAKTGKVTCSTGNWAGDSPEAQFYRSPHTFTYQWKKGGAVVSGANAATFTPASSGSYTCAAVGANAAGSTASQESAPANVKRLVRFSSPKFTRKTRGGKRVLSGKIAFASPAVVKTDCTGSVALKFVLKKKTIASKRFAVKYKNRRCTAAVSLKFAGKYTGKKVKLTLSIGKSTKLTATPKTVSTKL